ncbi:MAG: hypothetical protein H0U76_10640 [Ktedonobacteraceae bacterium]|nr:hypothetical protein [Ktedonobacteraceae bacterium]MBA3915482.1 hypothetical protein [Terriglobales bacterium]
MTVRFDQAYENLLGLLAGYVEKLPTNTRLVVVRDLRSQIRLIVDTPEQLMLSKEDEEVAEAALGAYKAPGDFIINLLPQAGFSSIFDAPEAIRLPNLPANIRFVDRMVTGREWLYPVPAQSSQPHRLAFFGLKGGVGRSTALSMTAWHLAQLEKRVLVIDLDLESPGLGNMLLPYRSDLLSDDDTGVPGWPMRGMVDWFVEDAVGQADEELLRDMVQPTPINGIGRGEVIVIPAAGGAYRQDYVSKLSRAYTDFPGQEKTEVFGDRLLRALSDIENTLKPDITLLDSRAGIHHISATILTRIADISYIFASDSRQTWAGLDSLFSHWTLNKDSVRAVREKLRLVSALTPATSNREEWRDAFGENAFDSFARLYDEEPVADSNQDEADDLFSFGVFEDDAPHRPILVFDNPVYVQFEPLLNTVQLDADNAARTFGELFDSVDLDTAQGEANESH